MGDESSEDESELSRTTLVEDFDKVSLEPASYQYHGKSSSMILVRNARDLNKLCQENNSQSVPGHPDTANSSSAPTLDFRVSDNKLRDMLFD